MELDLNQMVSVVRGEIAKRAAYVHFDQILTAVLDADNALAKATKDLADIERQVQSKSQSLIALEKQAHGMIEEAERAAQAKREAVERDCEELIAKAAEAIHKLDEEAAKLLEHKVSLTDEINKSRFLAKQANDEKVQAEKELARVRKQMAELGASLKV
jgi:chromosome segregation ATPase